MSRLLLLVLAGLLLLAPREAAPAEAPLADLKAQVLRALDDKDPAQRARAFLPLHTRKEREALSIAVDGAAKAQGLVEKVRGDQAKAEAAYEKACTGLDTLEKAYEERNDNSPRATEAFNKAERKLSGQRDAARTTLRNLESELLATKALVDGAVVAASKVLANLPPTELAAGLDVLEQAWLRSKEESDALRYFDALGGVTGDEPRRRANGVVAAHELPVRVRAAAIDYLATVKDGDLPGSVVPFLEGPRERFDLTAAAIRAIQKVHRPQGIEPLIAFLGRPDKEIGRLRGDATDALRSLTGQKHGPYREPWETWWKEAEATFQMPAEPQPRNVVVEQGKGVTFYGIRTFSDRILLILDVSLSMEKPDQKDKPEPRRIDTAKKEAEGAIHNLDDGHTFNVLLFNHSVTPWQATMVSSSAETRRKAADWVKGAEHIGGTNIHDALEQAFRIALRVTGEPVVDTIFFMTDGTPTAGKIQEPKAILDQVREWNRQARLQIHCIAVGEADHEFLKALAEIGNGTFLRR
jgi:hypothetical protein